MVQVAPVLRGCGLALDPYLDPPDLTVHNAAASRRTLSLLLAALAAGAVILFPSLGYLFGSSRRTRSTTAWRPWHRPRPLRRARVGPGQS